MAPAVDADGRGDFSLTASYFLSERRYLLDHNTPQDPWYCMPAASVILTSPFRLAGHVYEDEGVYCGEPDLDHFLEDMILVSQALGYR